MYSSLSPPKHSTLPITISDRACLAVQNTELDPIEPNTGNVNLAMEDFFHQGH